MDMISKFSICIC
nr:unnamed protein product [Callosobruchus chinensis]